MPVTLRKHGDKYEVVEKDTGHVKKSYPLSQREKAQKYANLLNAIAHGWVPSKNK